MRSLALVLLILITALAVAAHTEQLEDRLERLAWLKMDDVLARSEIDHINADGCDLACRAKRAGFASGVVSENLYMGTDCTKEVIYKSWEGSPKHREVLEMDYDQYYLLRYLENKVCYAVYVNYAK